MPPKKLSKPGKSASKPDPTPPNWPAFKPLLPTSDLSISTIVSNVFLTIIGSEAICRCLTTFQPFSLLQPLLTSSQVPSQILTISNFWTSTLCKNYVSFLNTLPLTATPGKPKKGDALRCNDRFQVMDWGFANRLWVESGLREMINGNEEGEEGEEGGMSKEERRALW